MPGSVCPEGGKAMALPSLHLNEIPDEGLSLSHEVQPEELALDPGDAQVRGALSLTVKIAKAGAAVGVVGVLSGTFVRQCVRCLKEYDDHAEVPFEADYRSDQAASRHLAPGRAAGRSEGGVSGELGAEPERDDEPYVMTGDRLDLAEMLREHVILATPMQPLCREDCPGLCPVCGRDRNEGPCGCPQERRESPFAVLKHIIEAKGERR
ncbi:MAG: DUF177 domain-containing protein [Nitrospira sp.]|nr:DUF177 domain-containing protein [Nitrospira sp.]